MTGRRLRVLIVEAALVLIGVAWWTIEPTTAGLAVLDLVLFAVAAAVMELLPINLRDRPGVPTSLAVVGAAAVLGEGPHVVAAIAAAGLALSWALQRGGWSWAALRNRAVTGWVMAGVAAVGTALGPATWRGVVDAGVAAELNLGAAVAVAAAILVGAPALDVITHSTRLGRYGLRRIAEAVSEQALVSASVTSTAVLGALVHPVLGHWTLATMLVPLLAARVGLERLGLGRRAYDQTIRAMSRLPEQLGTVASGHGVRVGVLARDVALELGLDAASVSDVVRAAHLHELGRIQVERDVPAGQRDLAGAGASVIREVADLERVAEIVGLHGDPIAAGTGPEAVPARIVAACCELDRYAPDPARPGQRHEVVVRLVRQVGDIDVVAALARVVARAPAATG